MHPYVFIPLAAMISAGILASAIAAREPDRNANRLMGLVLLCVGYWSMCDFLRDLSPNAEGALVWIRISTLGSVMLGPLMLHNLIAHRAQGVGGFRRILPLAYGSAMLAGLTAASSDWLVTGVEQTPWGWKSVMGPALIPIYAIVAVFPLSAVASWFWTRGHSMRGLDRGVWIFQMGGATCFVVATLTDFVLPLFEVPFPRLGSASIVAWGAVTWWSLYRVREPALAHHRHAREILETLPDGVALVRLDGRIRITNERFAQLGGRVPEELMGCPVSKLISQAGPSDGAPDRGYESELITESGRRIPVSVRHTPLIDDDGHGIGEILVMRDMREVVSIRSRLVASGRLVAVGQLAAGIAHEINNPIAYVRANLGLLQNDWENLAEQLSKTPHGPMVRRALDEGPTLIGESAEGVDRIADIVREVGGFSRGGVVQEERVNLSELTDTAVRVAAPQLRGVRVERDLDGLPNITCVPQELLQVFLNLLLNASQAMGGSGVIRITGEARNNEIWVDVSDDGDGIEAEFRDRIFEPFFTTKPVGEGTGLGLSLSRQIVVNHGGTIEVGEAASGGARFRVRLPTGPAEAATANQTEGTCTPSN